MIYEEYKIFCDKKFIQLYVCQKLSKKVSIWKSYGKNRTVQFFASKCSIFSSLCIVVFLTCTACRFDVMNDYYTPVKDG